MKVFVIGASGYIGRVVTEKLLEAGHHVIALARSEESAARLPAGNVEVIRGDTADVDSLRRGLEHADGVIYLAIQGLRGPSPDDTTALNLIIDTLAGTNKPFIITSSIGVYSGLPSGEYDEETPLDNCAPGVVWRVQLERMILDAAQRGIRSIVIRPSIVYGRGSASPVFLAPLDYARKTGQSVYIGAGENVIPVVHVDDMAESYVLALEKASAGMVFNVAATAVSGKDIARGISYAAGLGGKITAMATPDAVTALGGLAHVLGGHTHLSGVRMALVLGWTPSGPSLLYELTHGSLSQPSR